MFTGLLRNCENWRWLVCDAGGWFVDSVVPVDGEGSGTRNGTRDGEESSEKTGEGGQSRLPHHVLPFWIRAFSGMTREPVASAK